MATPTTEVVAGSARRGAASAASTASSPWSSGCTVPITGGTETGHGTKGTRTHGSYKIGIGLAVWDGTCIKNHTTHAYDRGDARV
ncbi:hypothetical protein ACGFMM_24805 [Streptomyces sp. NPDC048604]|uniref:hypothetical protein n=1 Tax=Streptomyces sp. NPDC048604 TaxID=3365578 RepID=UPI0037161001